jgi:uncharacterized Tic20 family protein
MLGAIGAIVIWATQKDKSRYVAFQALHAVVYHIAMILTGFLGGVCYGCSIFAYPLGMALLIPGAESASGDISPLFFLGMGIPFAVMGAIMLGWFLFIVYGVVAAAMTLRGRDFRYPVIGKRLETYLAQE